MFPPFETDTVSVCASGPDHLLAVLGTQQLAISRYQGQVIKCWDLATYLALIQWPSW